MEVCLVPTTYLCQRYWFSSKREQSGGREGWQDFSRKRIKLVCGRTLQNKWQHLSVMKFLMPEENDKIFARFQFRCTYQIWAVLRKCLSPSPRTGVRWSWTRQERPPVPPHPTTQSLRGSWHLTALRLSAIYLFYICREPYFFGLCLKARPISLWNQWNFLLAWVGNRLIFKT